MLCHADRVAIALLFAADNGRDLLSTAAVEKATAATAATSADSANWGGSSSYAYAQAESSSYGGRGE